jgi:formate dehydrogenase subunit gamma
MSTATRNGCVPARVGVDNETRACVDAALRKLGSQPGPLLEILHAIQRELGHVPAGVVPVVADALNLSRAEVHGVLSFYHHFRATPPGRCVVQVCRAEACQAMNGDAIADAARKRLGIDFGETRADGSASLDAVYCLGNCALAPSVVIGGQIHGRCEPRDIAHLIDAWSVS